MPRISYAQQTPGLAWSAEARVTVRPAAAYRRLAASPGGATGWRWLARPVFFALMLGAFVSFTTSGRLTARLVLIEAVFWSVVPLLQASASAVVLRLFVRGRRLAPNLDLFFAGNGPWHLWLLAVSGVCLVAGTLRAPLWPLEKSWLLASFAAVLVASTRVRYAFFHDALGLSARQAALALVSYNALLWGTLGAYAAATGQLVPRLARYSARYLGL